MEYAYALAVIMFFFFCWCLPKIGRVIEEFGLALIAFDEMQRETYDPGHSIN